MRIATHRQLQVLDYLAVYAARYHCPPTFREVSDHFGFKSAQAAYRHLTALTQKGYLVPIIAGNGVHRGYRLSELGQRELIDFRQQYSVTLWTGPHEEAASLRRGA